MRVPLEEVRHLASNSRDLNNYIDGLFSKCKPDDPPYMSDLLLGFNQGGVHIMQALEERFKQDQSIDRPQEQRFKWKLKVLKDEFGQPVKPGDIVEHVIHRSPEHGTGKPMTSGEISVLKMNGFYERDWVTRIQYKVDDKGCITTGFVATSYFLQKFGVHGKTGAIISHHKVAHSGDPQEAPKEGMKHVHYWRFKEVDSEDYGKLDVITDEKHSQKRPSSKDGDLHRQRSVS